MTNPRTCSDKPDDIIEVNFRYTALIAMCLGFLFIWSAVISSIFLKNNLDEQSLVEAPVDMFRNQERIGQIMFQIGQEMLFTVDALVSVQLNLTSTDDLNQSVNFTWSLTDNEIAEVREEIEPPNDLVYLLATIESKLSLIRFNLSLETEHPLNTINSYKLIFDLAEQFTVERVMRQRKTHDSRWHLLTSFTEIQSAPYALFIKGMNRRFIELSYGTIYHIGPQLFSYTDTEAEISNYFYYFYSSHELIENAFSWDVRIHHRYVELLKSKHSQIFYSNSRFNLYRQTGREYTRFVTDVVAFLLNAKDVLNMSFREVLQQFSLKSNTTFYLLIATIYFTVLIACMVFFVLFVRNAKIKSEQPMMKRPVSMIANVQRY